MNNNKPLWQQPWQYKESFLIMTAILIGAGVCDIWGNTAVPPIFFPYNITIGIIALLCSMGIVLLQKKYAIFRWLLSVPASISAIAGFVGISAIMALTPQNPQATALHFPYNITSSWTYAITIGYFLIILGAISLKRLYPFSARNIGFALNHWGLYCIIFAASLGAGDVQKLNMTLDTGKTIWYGTKNQQTYELPFAIRLNEFGIDEYPAKFAFVHTQTGTVLSENGRNAIFDCDTSVIFQYKEWQVQIQDFLQSSAPVNNRFMAMHDFGSTQSARITIKNTLQDTAFDAWMASASILYPPLHVKINDSLTFIMMQPEPKRFYSSIRVYKNNGHKYDTIIEVNKPITIDSWKIYQTSYDETKGKWSSISILEVINDPWLIYVFIGFYMVIAGSAYLIWNGKKQSKTNMKKNSHVETF